MGEHQHAHRRQADRQGERKPEHDDHAALIGTRSIVL
jgi:hypothetical protein